MYPYNVFFGDCELRGLGNPEIRSQGYLHMALHQKSYWLWQVRHITYLNAQVATHEFQGWGHPWKVVPCSCRDLSPSQTWALPWPPLTPPPLQLCDIRKVMAMTLKSKNWSAFQTRCLESSARPGLGTSEAKASLKYKSQISFVNNNKNTPRRAGGLVSKDDTKEKEWSWRKRLVTGEKPQVGEAVSSRKKDAGIPGTATTQKGTSCECEACPDGSGEMDPVVFYLHSLL